MDPEMQPPPSKRFRVSLEPTPGPKITSIDTQGTIVYEPFVKCHLFHSINFCLPFFGILPSVLRHLPQCIIFEDDECHHHKERNDF
jgi:hypothetical protein